MGIKKTKRDWGKFPAGHDEDAFTAKCANYVLGNYPELRYQFFHIPNGDERCAGVGYKLKLMGVRSGVSDFALLLRGRTYWIELKMPWGILSRNQQQFMDAQKKIGNKCFVVQAKDSIDEGVEQFKKLFEELKNEGTLG